MVGCCWVQGAYSLHLQGLLTKSPQQSSRAGQALPPPLPVSQGPPQDAPLARVWNKQFMITHVNANGFFLVFKGKDINLKVLCMQNSSEIIDISIF